MNIEKRIIVGLLFLFAIIDLAATPATAAHYPSLESVPGLDVAYDFRLSNPETAALFLRLIHETYIDSDIRDLPESPRFVVVVNAAAVKLLAKGFPGHSPEDRKYIEEIAGRIRQMAADGIYFEGCLKAAELFGVDADMFPAEINRVKNAWISLAGYQAQQFSTMPIF